MAPPLEVRSYRAVFELERRIYRIDNLRLNPTGVPMRGIAYLLGLAGLSAVAAALPLARVVLAPVPWYIRELALPGVGAVLLTLAHVDGRPFHLFVGALLAHAAAPDQLSAMVSCPAIGARWRPEPIVFIPDGSDARIRRFRYRGPGVVLVALPHRRIEWRRGVGGRADVSLVGMAGRPLRNATAVELAPRAVLETAVSAPRRGG